MNRVSRALMSGASLAALTLGSVDLARAAGVTVNAATNAVTVANAQAEDFIVVTGTGSVTNNVTNNGTVGLPDGAFGIEVQNGGSVGGSIVNAGVVQAHELGVDVAAGAHFGGAVSNLAHGLIEVAASSTGNAAVSTAVHQAATVAGAASVKLANTGTILVNVHALGSGTETRASAAGHAEMLVNQSASGQGGESPANVATVQFTNTGIARATVAAHATGNSAFASASEFLGVRQEAKVTSGVGNANATLTNSGTISLLVQAVAKASSEFAKGHAFIRSGVLQEATGDSAAGSTAAVALTNSSTLNVVAKATATGGTDAEATADITTGISQVAENATNVSATLTNSSTLTVLAQANAKGGSSAEAFATIRTGFYQFVDAVGDSSAVNTVTNSGTVNIEAIANATGVSRAFASASISNTGIYQDATGADSSSSSVTNSGTISILAQADAKAATGYATAQAYIDYGVSQNAHASGLDVSATNSLVNSSTLNIEAVAKATGKTDASATASVYYGVIQDAQDGKTTTDTLTNSGTLNIVAQATANAGNNASAYAYMTKGISQTADASGVAASSAGATITNSGTLNIELLAKAVGGTQATATAYDESYGIRQEADGADNSSVSLTNSGTINITAQATANGGTGYADASAYQDIGIQQEAYASNTAASASVALTNSSTLNIESIAKATGGTDASATAYNYYPIEQYAEEAVASSVTLTNSGTVNLIASAQAKAGEWASAYAYIRTGISQYASGSSLTASTASATLTSSGTLNINAIAKATGASGASASAYIDDDGIFQEATDADSATVSLTNSGTINITAQAGAKGGTSGAYASAYIDRGIHQRANAVNTDKVASVTLNNTGTLNIEALAKATGGVWATASAGISEGISQEAGHGVQSTATLTSSGTLNIVAQATAKAGTSSGFATAWIQTGIYQSARADGSANASAVASLTNSGTLKILAKASEAGPTGTATAVITAGIVQHADDATTVTDTLTNSATLTISAAAVAKDTHFASALARIGGFTSSRTSGSSSAARPAGPFGHDHSFGFSSIGGGIVQGASANGVNGVANVSLTNSGTLNILANATADGSEAQARALDIGILQFAGAEKNASASLTNSGTINIDAAAKATGVRSATVEAVVLGNVALVGSTNPTISLTNSGSLNVLASANAKAATSAGAFGVALGIDQFLPEGGAANFTNSGTFTVEADASATATHSGALAEAAGLIVGPPFFEQFFFFGRFAAPPSGPLNVNISNTGTYAVTAKQVGSLGEAAAVGMIIESFGVPIAGKVENDGTMLVTANGSNANAEGMIVLGNQFQGTIVNKGKMIVSAVAPAGHAAHATGIAVARSSFSSSSLNQPASLPGGTVVNNGKLWVGHSASPGNPDQHAVALVNGTIINDGGTLVAEQTIGGITTRGTAITVLGAPNPINILLKGTGVDGHVYGDIEVRNGDTVTVSNGKTLFDGIINDAADKVSALSISADGTLEFVNNLAEGPAHAYVNTFTQAGTLGLEVNPTPVAVAPTATTTAGFVSANSATLGGGVLLTLAPGIYADHTTYQVVFSATPIGGTWSGVGTTSNSALLKPQAVYTANEADIVLTRVAFDDVPGLTPNEEDVADGIESSYGGSDNGPFNTLAGDLVTLDQADYKKALDLLGDADDGELDLFTIQGVEKFLDTLGVHISNLGAGGSASNEGPTRVTPAQLIPIQFGSGEVWGSIYGSWSNIDSTISGPKASGSQNGMAVGLDAPISKNTIVGAALNYSAGTLKIDGGRAHGSYSGFSGALYGRYDDDQLPWYATATGSFGGYADRSRRFVSIPGPAGGSGIYSSRFFSRVWSLYGEAGYEVARDNNFTVTPYAALEVLQGTTGAYASSETTILSGSPLPTLSVSSVTATSVDSRIGAAIATQLTLGEQTVLPSLRIAWLHEFNDNPWVVNAAFAGVPTSGFRITGAGLTSNFLDLDAGITMKLEDSLNALIDYEGRISSDRQDHALIGRLVVKL